MTVVGLVADTRYRELSTRRPTVYIAYAHGIPVTPAYLAVRGPGPALVVGAIRRALADREPGAVVVNVEPLPRLLATPLARPRFQATLAACFAVLALLPSVVGAFGVLSFMVRQRRREIGIRMALGAAPSNVRLLVLRPGFAIGTILTVWCALFFRDPVRVTPVREGIVVSPADGRVSMIAQVLPPAELGLGDRPLLRISVFMSVFNCHVNRSPVAGRIDRIAYRPGAFINAELDKASEDKTNCS